MKNYNVITPLFPTYDQTRAMMKAVAGCSLKSVRNMITSIRMIFIIYPNTFPP